MSTSKPTIKRLKSQPITLQFAEGGVASNIDEENGILKNVVMCQVGEAKGHGMHLEQEFIDNLIAYDKENFGESGLKVRFGHPALSDSVMGTQMGKFHNFKVVGEKAVADLHLMTAADLSPTKPNMRKWMIEMAKEQPDFVMMSIVFRAENYYQRDENGEKYEIWTYVEVEDEDGKVRDEWRSKNPEYGKVYVAFDEEANHFYTDAVEAGAATDALFASQFNKEKYAVKAAQWLSEESPEILNFLKENPAKLLEFAEKCGIEIPREKYTISDKLKAAREYLFGKEYQPTIEEAEEFTPFDEKIHLTQEAHQEAIALATATHDENIETQKNIYEAKIAELNARISELEKMPVDVDTSFETSQANAGSDKQLLTSWDRKLIAEQKSRKS